MKHRRFLLIVIAAIMLVTAIPVMAEEHIFTIEDGVLTSYRGPGGDVVIPDGVRCISQYAFKKVTNITKITVPRGVTVIENFAFSGMDLLKTVSLPEGLKKIGRGAFARCYKLESIILPSTVNEIGERAFEYCENLVYAELSPKLQTVPDYAFFGCTSLKQVEIPNGVKSLQFDVFGCCESLTRIDLPSSLHTIGESAFYNCMNLEEVNISNGTTTISDRAFNECRSLTDIDIPMSVKSIGEDVFKMCTSLGEIRVDNRNTFYTSVDGVLYNTGKTKLVSYPEGKQDKVYVMPDSVTEVSRYAISGCDYLEELTLSANLAEIGYAGISCGNLGVVNIPGGLGDINLSQLRNCEALAKFNIDETNTAYALENGILYNFDMTELKYVPRTISGSFTVRDGVKKIADYAFSRCENITEVILPDGLEEIGQGAFDYCYGIKELFIPYGVKSMNISPEVSGIREMHVPPTVEEFGSVYVIIEPFTAYSKLYIVKGSSAEKYAKSIRAYVEYIDYWVEQDGEFVKYYGESDIFCVPDSITSFADGAFDGAEGITLHCLKDSVAVKYAEDNGISCVTYDEVNAGDTNGDGNVNLTDATELMKYIAEWDTADVNLPGADVDNDGKVTLADVTLILKHIAGWNVLLK